MKKVILSVLAILVLGSIILLTGCVSGNTYFPVDGKSTNTIGIITCKAIVIAQEYVVRDNKTHTILYLRGYTSKDDRQIEVNNYISFQDYRNWWSFEFTPTETPNVYTITQMVFPAP